MTAPSKPANRPAYTLRYGSVHVAIWPEITKEGHTRYAATVDRRYEVNGEWKTSRTFRKDELLEAAQALTDAYRFIAQDLLGAMKAPRATEFRQPSADAA
ncbi:MAG: hypothetical protein IT434_12890 [Phycisphaerales bacterium]|nr:hypothetical protein [Phycisphaerales bacterium]